jgi:hypothetical protein
VSVLHRASHPPWELEGTVFVHVADFALRGRHAAPAREHPVRALLPNVPIVRLVLHWELVFSAGMSLLLRLYAEATRSRILPITASYFCRVLWLLRRLLARWVLERARQQVAAQASQLQGRHFSFLLRCRLASPLRGVLCDSAEINPLAHCCVSTSGCSACSDMRPTEAAAMASVVILLAAASL